MRWAIVGVHGLYIGQWQLRKDAIDGHCENFTTDHSADGLARVWQKKKRQGDRVIKVRITEYVEAPTP